ncbi:unnamed protein product [Protopolystoma xenopodis]|uniref:Uncharacterized protein n=1 Tax=Protopolystoma xenopodis TaxID=117903 RepID=A0A3S5CVR0_9PLAT|nr:unnamed protein product [Protopolystoma xenopodis]
MERLFRSTVKSPRSSPETSGIESIPEGASDYSNLPSCGEWNCRMPADARPLCPNYGPVFPNDEVNQKNDLTCLASYQQMASSREVTGSLDQTVGLFPFAWSKEPPGKGFTTKSGTVRSDSVADVVAEVKRHRSNGTHCFSRFNSHSIGLTRREQLRKRHER